MEHVISRVSAAANKYIDFIIKGGGSVFPSGYGGGGGGGVSTFPPSFLSHDSGLRNGLPRPELVMRFTKSLVALHSSGRHNAVYIDRHSLPSPPCLACSAWHSVALSAAMLCRLISPALHGTPSLCRVLQQLWAPWMHRWPRSTSHS